MTRGFIITTALANTSSKKRLKCSFTIVNSAFARFFSSSWLRSLRYAKAPKRVLTLSTSLVLSFLLWGCASTTPTQYYSLNAGQLEASYALDKQISLGVLAVSIPDQLERSGLVSRKGINELTVSSYHIWAGDLGENISAFLTDALAQRLDLDDVRSAPWNTNLRPEYQLEVSIDQFSGQMNGEVVLKASYSLLKDKGQTQVLVRRFNLSTKASGGYIGYVNSLNDLMLEFVDELARQIQGELGK